MKKVAMPNKWLLFLLLFGLLTAGCSSSGFVNYTLPGSKNIAWHIQVKRSREWFSNVFQVTINDTTVIRTDKFHAQGTYRGHDVRLLVTFSWATYHATVYVDNEIIAKFDFFNT